MRRLLRATAAPLVALGGGVLWGLQFGRQGFLLTPWVALAPLLLLLSHRRAAGLAFLHGLAAWLTAIYWIAPTLRTYGGLDPLTAVGGLLLLAAYLAAYHAAFAGLGRRLWRRAAAGGARRIALALAGLPALWVALEWIRGHLFSGFPWNLAGYAWVEVPGALPAAAWIGAFGVSAVVVFANAGVALAAARRRLEPLALGVLAPLLLLAVAGRWAVPPQPPPLAPQPARVLQPDIPIAVEFDAAAAVADYDKLLALSRQACDTGGALLIWPESAGWPYAFDSDPGFRADVEMLARRCPVLLNSPRKDARGRWFNSGLLVTPGAPPERYDKRHLVPFGEYVPLARVLPFVGSLARNAGDFTAAQDLELLPWGRESLGLAICFEVIFPAEVAETVQAGATVLVTITNDAWYGDTSAPWQHLRAARFRAAENRRPLLRAALTGVSAVVAPDGSLRGMLGVGAEGYLRAAVAGRRDRSPYSRRPSLVPLVCALTALFAIFAARRRERRDREKTP